MGNIAGAFAGRCHAYLVPVTHLSTGTNPARFKGLDKVKLPTAVDRTTRSTSSTEYHLQPRRLGCAQESRKNPLLLLLVVLLLLLVLETKTIDPSGCATREHDYYCDMIPQSCKAPQRWQTAVAYRSRALSKAITVIACATNDRNCSETDLRTLLQGQ